MERCSSAGLRRCPPSSPWPVPFSSLLLRSCWLPRGVLSLPFSILFPPLLFVAFSRSLSLLPSLSSTCPSPPVSSGARKLLTEALHSDHAGSRWLNARGRTRCRGSAGPAPTARCWCPGPSGFSCSGRRPCFVTVKSFRVVLRCGQG